MRFVRGNVRDHIVTPKSTTALRSGTTERFRSKNRLSQDFLRHQIFDFFYRRNADIRYGTDVGKGAKKS